MSVPLDRVPSSARRPTILRVKRRRHEAELDTVVVQRRAKKPRVSMLSEALEQTSLAAEPVAPTNTQPQPQPQPDSMDESGPAPPPSAVAALGGPRPFVFNAQVFRLVARTDDASKPVFRNFKSIAKLDGNKRRAGFVSRSAELREALLSEQRKARLVEEEKKQFDAMPDAVAINKLFNVIDVVHLNRKDDRAFKPIVPRRPRLPVGSSKGAVYADMLAEYLHSHDEETDTVYDWYALDEGTAADMAEDAPIIQIDPLGKTFEFEHAFGEDDHDSEDSNAEGHYRNDYPSGEEEEEEEDSEADSSDFESDGYSSGLQSDEGGRYNHTNRPDRFYHDEVDFDLDPM